MFSSFVYNMDIRQNKYKTDENPFLCVIMSSREVESMKKTNKIVIIFLIVITILSLTNLLNIKVDGEALKLLGISVIVGVIAYFVTRKTNLNKFIKDNKDKFVII